MALPCITHMALHHANYCTCISNIKTNFPEADFTIATPIKS